MMMDRIAVMVSMVGGGGGVSPAELSGEDIREGVEKGMAGAAELGEAVQGLIRDLPWSAHGMVVGTLVLGLVLWLFGRRSLRLAFAGLGAWGGAVLGMTLPSMVGIEAATWIGVLVGGVVGLVLGLSAFRFTIAVSLGCLFGVLGPFVAAGLMHVRPLAELESAGGVGADEGLVLELDGGGGRVAGVPGLAGLPGLLEPADGDEGEVGEGEGVGEAEETIREGALRAREFFGLLWDELRPHWEGQGERERVVIIASGVGGFAIGIALGMLLPRKSAGLVTGFVGAAMWLFAGVWLAGLAGVGLPGVLPDSASGWSALWLVLGLVGTLFQWSSSARRGRRKRASGSEG